MNASAAGVPGVVTRPTAWNHQSVVPIRAVVPIRGSYADVFRTTGCGERGFHRRRGSNLEAAEVIQSVVMEEMLHLTLAANLLNTVGGRARIADPEFVPDYGRHGITLPDSGMHFRVGLERFAPATIETFLKIEQPAAKTAPPEGDHDHSIGQFYDAIDETFDYLVGAHGAKRVFTGKLGRQIAGSDYYGGGGTTFAVTDLASAHKAIAVIEPSPRRLRGRHPDPRQARRLLPHLQRPAASPRSKLHRQPEAARRWRGRDVPPEVRRRRADEDPERRRGDDRGAELRVRRIARRPAYEGK